MNYLMRLIISIEIVWNKITIVITGAFDCSAINRVTCQLLLARLDSDAVAGIVSCRITTSATSSGRSIGY